MAFSCARRQPKIAASAAGRRQEPKRLVSEPTGGDELRELSETFRLTVGRLSSLVGELEEAHRQTLQVEEEKKQFYRDVIRAVTSGKFDLVDAGDVPNPGPAAAELPVRDGREYADARCAIRAICEEACLGEDQSADLLLAAGEAITNAMKHATEGRCFVYRTEDDSTRETKAGVVIRVCDSGSGIRSAHLPAAILTPGFSTKVSLGMGYTMMLKLCDHVWLATGPDGTLVQLEKHRVPDAPLNPLDFASFNGL